MASLFAEPCILLNASEVRVALPMSEAIEAMRRAFADLQAGRATVPLRTAVSMARFGGSALFMPAYGEEDAAFVVKIATIHEGNRAKGLDAVQAMVLLFDAESGRATAIMDGKSVTAIRTGAGSGLATDLLARQDARVLAMFGSGVQARSHLRAVCDVRDIRRVLCIGRSPASIERFATEMRDELGIEVVVGADAAAALEADIICTATTSREPILAARDVRDGAHINAVGTHRSSDTEIAADLVLKSKVVVDQLSACLEEAGEVVRPMRAGLIDKSHIFAELGELVEGSKPGRQTASEITLFKSVGNAVQDLAAAVTAARNARRLGLGTPVQL